MTMTADTPTPVSNSKWNIGLWVAAVVLALLYVMPAFIKLTAPQADLVAMGLVWVANAPMALVRFIGLAELLGVIGLLLPAATRIMPKLTIYAAMGLGAVQVLAIPFHIFRGEFEIVPLNLILLGLSALIVWGRTSKAPIAPRG